MRPHAWTQRSRRIGGWPSHINRVVDEREGKLQSIACSRVTMHVTALEGRLGTGEGATRPNNGRRNSGQSPGLCARNCQLLGPHEANAHVRRRRRCLWTRAAQFSMPSGQKLELGIAAARP